MRLTVLAAAIAVTLTLAGCAPQGTVEPTTDPVPTESVTPEPQPAVVIMSLDGLTVQDDAGGTVESAEFTDPDAILDLLSELLGSTPEPTQYPEIGNQTYEWPGVLFGTGIEEPSDYSWVRAEVAQLGDLPLQTSDGIHVGSALADVEALGPFEVGYDGDGDGVSDELGLEQQANPAYESLGHPGEPGTDFVAVQIAAGAVTVVRSPSNDYSDV